MTRPGNTTQINVSIPNNLNDELRKEAEEVNRSFSNYIAHLFKMHKYVCRNIGR